MNANRRITGISNIGGVRYVLAVTDFPLIE